VRAGVIAVIALAGLSACAVTRPEPPKATPIPYALDAGGVQLADRPLRIDFGRTDHSTIPAMTKLVGQAETDRGICPDGRPFVVWPDGVALYFEAGAFVGWSLRRADGQVERAGRTCL
jgi:hypothetical protein